MHEARVVWLYAQSTRAQL